MNKCLTTDMADANRLRRAVRPTGFFNIKKMAADLCSVQCIMDNTGSLRVMSRIAHRGGPHYSMTGITNCPHL